MYADGQSVQKDYSVAAVYYKKACDGGDWQSCTNLGNLYENGQGVLKDLREAAHLHELSCKGGNSLGCDGLHRISSQ